MNKLPTDIPIDRYILTPPEGVYPLNGDDPTQTHQQLLLLQHHLHAKKEYVYPDFNRWKYSPEQDRIMQNYLQKGYFDSPAVGNELLSAKTAVHQLLHTDDPLNSGLTSALSTNSTSSAVPNEKLACLSNTIIKAIHYRRKCNKASMKYTYKPPPRVTLTEQKKEQWLVNLANSSIPLSKLSRTIPHGIRNKVLLEQCCSKQIPIKRLLWFVKCVGTNELRGLRRKVIPSIGTGSGAGNSNKVFELNWTHDWTIQVTEYLEKLEKDCFVIHTDDSALRAQWRRNLDYMVKLTLHLYMAGLVNRERFLTWIVRFSKRICPTQAAVPGQELGDFKLISVHFIFIKLFWCKIIEIDYLAKEMSEILLLVYHKLQDGKLKLPSEITLKLSSSFKFFILYLFYYNAGSFIMSNHWTTLKPVLKRVINLNDPLIAQQFELITYRNESLLMNSIDSELSMSSDLLLVKRLDNFSGDIEEMSKCIYDESNVTNGKPTSSGNTISFSWKRNIHILLNWCCTNYKKSKTSQLYLTISLIKFFLKKNLSKSNSKISTKKAKLEIESIILEFIYNTNDRYTSERKNQLQDPYISNDNLFTVDLDKFILLVNELYALKLFTVSSYLRRLISSGIIYLPNAQCKTLLHIMIIQNLPLLNNAQCQSILKSLNGENDGIKFQYNLNKSKENVDLILNWALNDAMGMPNGADDMIIDNGYLTGFIGTIGSATTTNSNAPVDSALSFIAQQNDGIKALTLDYFILKIQTKISQALDLNPTILAVFHGFFHSCNRPLRFFQDLLSLILSNETKTVNFQLDSLYFISNMIVSNAAIIDCSIPSDYMTNSKTFFNELVRGMISNYHILKETSQGNACTTVTNPSFSFSFTSFWRFCSNKISFEGDSILLSELEALSNDKTIWNNKNQAVQPYLQLQNDDENLKASLKLIGMNLTVEQFLNYDRSRANSLKLLEKLLSTIKMEQSGCGNGSSNTNSTENVHSNDQANENSLAISVIIELLNLLKNLNVQEFPDHVLEFCSTAILPSLYLDFESYLKFGLKLIIFELIDISDLVQIFVKESSVSDNITGNSNHRLIWMLLMDKKMIWHQLGLNFYEIDKFELTRQFFKDNHLDQMLKFIQMGITDAYQTSFSLTTSPETSTSPAMDPQSFSVQDHLPTPVSNNVMTPLLGNVGGNGTNGDSTVGNSGAAGADADLVTSAIIKNNFLTMFEDEVSSIFSLAAFTNVHLLIDNIVSKLSKNLMLEVFNKLVLLENREIQKLEDLGKLIDIVNIYNLPLCQIILKIVWESELGPDKNEEFKLVATQDILMTLLNKIVKLDKSNEDEKNINSCFNQLFNLLGHDYKLLILDSCKSFFLRSEQFPQVYLSSDDQQSLIPYLSEIINNCSKVVHVKKAELLHEEQDQEQHRSHMIPLNDSLVFSLNAALEKLIYTSEKLYPRHGNLQLSNEDHHEINELDKTNLILSTNLVLKIILIHKQFLVELILKRSSNDISQDTFIRNLSRLYKSGVVRSDTKLKNYFYDSLLSIELSFTDTLSQEFGSKKSEQDHRTGSGTGSGPGTDNNISNMFHLPPLNTENALWGHLSQLKFRDGLIDLKESEKLYLYNEKEAHYEDFNIRAIDLIEDANPVAALNNTSISLQLFNASTERKNPA